MNRNQCFVFGFIFTLMAIWFWFLWSMNTPCQMLLAEGISNADVICTNKHAIYGSFGAFSVFLTIGFFISAYLTKKH